MRLPKTFKKTICSTFIASTLGVTLVMGAAATPVQASGYEIIDVGALPASFSVNGFRINDAGHFVGVGTNLLDNPIRVSLLNPSTFPNIEDLNNLTPQNYLQIRGWLNEVGGSLNNPTRQKLSRARGYLYDGQFHAHNDLLDVIEPETDELTGSNDLFWFDMSNNGWMVGEHRPPFLQLDTESNIGEPRRHFVRDQLPIATVYDGENFTFLHGEPDLLYGGTSRAHGINDLNQVVGFASVGERERLLNAYEQCTTDVEEDEDGNLVPVDLEPLDACMYRFWANGEFTAVPRQPFYEEEAYLWQLDAQGNVVSQQRLGVSFELPEGEEPGVNGYIRSVAVDINNESTAIGFTTYAVSTNSQTYATLFRDNEATFILDTTVPGFTQSRAVAINDNGYVVGHARRFPLQFGRERLFVKDINSEAEAEFPTGFFNDSSWQPRGMNNQNIVVGLAERDRTQATTRRTVGFSYNIDTGELIDLNTLIPCDSGYYIVDAMSINEHGEILAMVINERSEQVDDRLHDGLSSYPVILRMSDSIEPCGDTRSQQERSGAAISPTQGVFFGIFALFAVITRRLAKKK